MSGCVPLHVSNAITGFQRYYTDLQRDKYIFLFYFHYSKLSLQTLYTLNKINSIAAFIALTEFISNILDIRKISILYKFIIK